MELDLIILISAVLILADIYLYWIFNQIFSLHEFFHQPTNRNSKNPFKHFWWKVRFKTCKLLFNLKDKTWNLLIIFIIKGKPYFIKGKPCSKKEYLQYAASGHIYKRPEPNIKTDNILEVIKMRPVKLQTEDRNYSINGKPCSKKCWTSHFGKPATQPYVDAGKYLYNSWIEGITKEKHFKNKQSAKDLINKIIHRKIRDRNFFQTHVFLPETWNYIRHEWNLSLPTKHEQKLKKKYNRKQRKDSTYQYHYDTSSGRFTVENK
ncbi:MAG: hypothetical protein WC389_17110 [Lutibacter sp.]|jgi:hypothetical protein